MPSAASALMEAYSRIRPIISELRFLESERMHEKMEEINGVIQDKKWWRDLQGTTYGTALGLKAALLLSTSLVGGDVAKVMQTVAPFFDHGVQAATSYEEAQMFVPMHKESLFTQGYASEKSKQQSMKELEDEMRRTVSQLLQQRAEATRRAASAAG